MEFIFGYMHANTYMKRSYYGKLNLAPYMHLRHQGNDFNCLFNWQIKTLKKNDRSCSVLQICNMIPSSSTEERDEKDKQKTAFCRDGVMNDS